MGEEGRTGIESAALISSNDRMFRPGSEDHYWLTGQDGLRSARLALEAARTATPQRILDLPSGHGRVLRWLRHEWPEAEITACDIDRDGVDFCAETFGAIALYSTENPSQISLEGYYDLIWVGSLFTHLPEYRWCDFLSLLCEHLSGVLVFTTAGHEAAQRVGLSLSDFSFRPWQDRGGTYGNAYSTPEWVLGLLRQYPLRVVQLHEAGWDAHQDVFGCVPSDSRPVRAR